MEGAGWLVGGPIPRRIPGEGFVPNRDGGEGLGAEGSVQGGVLFHPLFG